MAGTGYVDPMDIRVLTLAEAVRARPGMYFGSVTDDLGLHDWLASLLGLATSHARELEVVLRRDGSVAVRFDEPGPAFGAAVTAPVAQPHRELAMVGVASAWLRCEIASTAARVVFEYRDGDLVTTPVTAPQGERAGVAIEAMPDPELFGPMTLSRVFVERWLETAADLHPGLATSVVDDREEPVRRVDARGDLPAWVERLAGERRRLVAEPIVVERRRDHTAFTLAMLWVDDVGFDLRSVVNGSPTPAGGCHVDALWTSLAGLTDGLVAVLVVEVPSPRFGLASRCHLIGPSVPLREMIEDGVREVFDHIAAARPAIIAPRSTAPPLEVALAASPTDAATALVYADSLAQRGDPRGELIALQSALVAEPAAAARDVLDHRAATLLADERTRIWGRPGGFPFVRKWRGRRYFHYAHRFELADPRAPARRFLDELSDRVVDGNRCWFRLADGDRVPLPYQRAGWYAHGRGLTSSLAIAEGRVDLSLSLPFDDLTDPRFARIRGRVAELFGDHAANPDHYQRYTPGALGDGMSPG
jgi:uncharacterized protein (TIGR02996 family)|nr:TIGR02996 domain-containing protein [Kofleriaceae bacterium]